MDNEIALLRELERKSTSRGSGKYRRLGRDKRIYTMNEALIELGLWTHKRSMKMKHNT
jgi:hypothetical protein